MPDRPGTTALSGKRSHNGRLHSGASANDEWKRADDGPRAADPVKSAKQAGLRYVTDAAPGIGRRRSGAGFVYVGPTGRAVKDEQTLRRIRSLVIPPAWTDVW